MRRAVRSPSVVEPWRPDRPQASHPVVRGPPTTTAHPVPRPCLERLRRRARAGVRQRLLPQTRPRQSSRPSPSIPPRCSARASARPSLSGLRTACSSPAGAAPSGCPGRTRRAFWNMCAISTSAWPRMMRACFSRAACASRDIASCSDSGMTTSRISTDCTVTPHGFDRWSMSFCSSSSIRSRPSQQIAERGAADDVAQRRLRRPAHRLLVVLHLERRLLRVVDQPEQHRVDVDRHGVGGQRLLGGEAGGDHALIDPRVTVSTNGMIQNRPGPRSPT